MILVPDLSHHPMKTYIMMVPDTFSVILKMCTLHYIMCPNMNQHLSTTPKYRSSHFPAQTCNNANKRGPSPYKKTENAYCID